MSKIIEIPVEGTRVFDMRKTRGYISIKNGKFYHKFRDVDAYTHWINTNEIKLCWGDTVWDLIKDAM